MSRITKQDTNGVKPLLSTGELGYDNYPTGGDVGRVYVGTGAANIALAKKTEVTAVDTKADTHIGRVDNPHNVTKSQIGLSNVDNTADSTKSVSYATTAGTASASDVYSWAKAVSKPSYTASEVGLGNVTNESKATMFTSPTFTGTVKLPSTTSIGNVSSTELGYIDGVTSSIQTQLDSKVAKVTSTDNAVVRFDGTTGNLQNSSVVIDDSGNLTTDATLKATRVSAATGLDSVTIGGWDNVNHRVEYVNRPLKITGYGTNSDIIFANNNDSEKMRIDSAGRVTMPYQPAFSAKYADNYTYTISPSFRTPTYGEANINIGNNYNTSTSIFTAPVAGVYFFSCGIGANSTLHDDGFAVIELYINGLFYTYQSHCTGLGSGVERGVNGTFTVKLNANDTVQFRPYCSISLSTGGGTHSASAWMQSRNFFSGYLIG